MSRLVRSVPGAEVMIEEDEEIVEAAPRTRRRRTEIPVGTPVRKLAPGVAEGVLPLHWPNPKMTTVANEGKVGNTGRKANAGEIRRLKNACLAIPTR